MYLAACDDGEGAEDGWDLDSAHWIRLRCWKRTKKPMPGLGSPPRPYSWMVPTYRPKQIVDEKGPMPENSAQLVR